MAYSAMTWSNAPILACVAMVTLGGCVGRGPLEVMSDPPLEETRALYSDTTRITYMFGHGAQVSYSSSNGKIYLWYPGNKSVLEGSWRLLEGTPSRAEGPRGPVMLAENRICFTYGPNTYNPVTKQWGGTGDCIRTKAFGRYVTELRRGDVFGLSHRREVPFVRSSAPTTIDGLLAQMPSGS